jgi:hypothetical protein
MKVEWAFVACPWAGVLLAPATSRACDAPPPEIAKLLDLEQFDRLETPSSAQ